MQEKTFAFEDKNFIIRRIKSIDDVVIFKVFQLKPSPNLPELALLFGLVNKKLVELTPRFKENSRLLDTFHIYIEKLCGLSRA